MRVNQAVALSEHHKAIVSAILRARSDKIGTVKVFGSRATGRARPASDLDLVVYPPASDRDIGDLRFDFDESDLPITVDVLVWENIDHQPLRDEIARHAVPFFR